jgi:hypothetical protein
MFKKDFVRKFELDFMRLFYGTYSDEKMDDVAFNALVGFNNIFDGIGSTGDARAVSRFIHQMRDENIFGDDEWFKFNNEFFKYFELAKKKKK